MHLNLSTRMRSAFVLLVLCSSLIKGTIVFLVPVYEWTLVWEDVRNIGYIYGSIWRYYRGHRRRKAFVFMRLLSAGLQ